MAEGRAEQGGGGRGWPEHRAVRGARRSGIWRNFMQSLEGRQLPAGAGQTGGDPQRRRRDPPLGIPTVKDRIVQTALKMVIEPIFEVQFRPGSYGFRPGRGCKDALREVDRLLKEGYTLRGGCRPEELLRHHPARPADGDGWRSSISDGRVLALIEGFLEQDIMKDMERWTPTTGTPQGAVISSAAGQYLSAPARPADGAERIPDGALRG